MEATVRRPFSAHIAELRRRLLCIVATAIVGAAVGYAARDFLVSSLQRPLGQPLFYGSPSGAFQFVLILSLGAGILLALPVLVYNLIRFIEPALSSRRLSGRFIAALVAASCILAGCGVAFAYELVVPAALHFFNGYSSALLHPLIGSSDYLSFTVGCMATFAIIFQLPLVLLAISRMTNIPPGTLGRYRRHVFIASFGVALVLPFTYDPVTQFLVALPLVGLYEISILLLWITRRRDQPINSPAQAATEPGLVPVPERPKGDYRPAKRPLVRLG